MNKYVPVVDDEADDPIELPLEDNGTLLLSTLTAQFTGACGLKYRNPETQVFRGVRLSEGRLYPPDGSWMSDVFVTVYPKERRKGETTENSRSNRTVKRCSDLIILGLPWKSTEDDLRNHFSQFGELIMAQVKRDPVTKLSKGFGFIRFSDYDAQVKAMSQRHNLDGRYCDLRIPNSKESANPELLQKIYVGRLTESITAEDLRTYFSQYGEVTEVYLPKPFRAFAFVTFSDCDVAASLCGDDHILKGVSIHVGSATPKSMDQRGGGSDMGWGGKGRYGGAEEYGAVGTRGGGHVRGGRGYGGGYGHQTQSYGAYAGHNQIPINNAMMAAAQAALFGFMTQAAAGAGAMGPGFGSAGPSGAGYGGYSAPPGGYAGGNAPGGGSGNYSGNVGYSGRFGGGGGAVAQSGGSGGGSMGAYATSSTGQAAGAQGGTFNGSGVYVSSIDVDSQGAPIGTVSGTRWN